VVCGEGIGTTRASVNPILGANIGHFHDTIK